MLQKTLLIQFIMCSMLFMFSKTSVIAQERNRQKFNEIIQAEINFAEQAKNHGLPYAFLNNLDSTGLIVNGNKIINGLIAYKKVLPDSNELLTWWPVYAYTNQSNNFGFTSGPYLYYENKNEKSVASGYYFSIWAKNSEGNFKVKFDGGVNHTKMKGDNRTMLSRNLPQTKIYFGKKNKNSKLSECVSEFEILHKQSEFKALKKFAAAQILILRPDEELKTNYIDHVNSKPKNDKKVPLRKKIGDGFDKEKNIYYEYGNLACSEILATEIYCGFYISVWENQSSGWKIIADISQFKPR